MSGQGEHPGFLWDGSEELDWNGLFKQYKHLRDNQIFLDIKIWQVTITMKMIRENLRPGQWFNQEILTIWIEWWKDFHHSQMPHSNFYFANTYLWVKLEQAHKEKEEAMQDPNNRAKERKHQQTMSAINKWFKNQKRPAKIFVPVNKDKHWYLVVVAIDWDGSRIEIEVNDSFHCPQTFVANVILDWVKEYYSNQTGKTFQGITNIMYRVGKQDKKEAPSPDMRVDPTYEPQRDCHTCGSWMCCLIAILSMGCKYMELTQSSVNSFHAFLAQQIVSMADSHPGGKWVASTGATELPQTYVEENGKVVIPSSDDEPAGVDPHKKRKVSDSGFKSGQGDTAASHDQVVKTQSDPMQNEPKMLYGGQPDPDCLLPSDDDEHGSGISHVSETDSGSDKC